MRGARKNIYYLLLVFRVVFAVEVVFCEIFRLLAISIPKIQPFKSWTDSPTNRRMKSVPYIDDCTLFIWNPKKYRTSVKGYKKKVLILNLLRSLLRNRIPTIQYFSAPFSTTCTTGFNLIHYKALNMV